MSLYYVIELVMGFSLVLWGVGALINPNVVKSFLRLGTSNDETYELLSYLLAFIFLMLGLAIIVVHNDWFLQWSIITTLIGWVVTIKSFLWLAFRKKVKKIVQKFQHFLTASWFNIAYNVVLIVAGSLILFNYYYYI